MGDTEPALSAPLSEPLTGPLTGPLIEPLIGEPVGPVLTGVPVLASDGSVLGVVGADLDGRLRVWRGQPGSMEVVGEPPHLAQLVALVHQGGRWHLFGADLDRRSRHATSDDLVTWHDDQRFVDEHPNLSVRGAAATSNGVVLLGQVIVHRRRMGWTLLEEHEGSFAAREVAFPLTADHEVVGPVHLGDDDLALVVVSGSSNLVARSISGTRGRSWTLGLLDAEITPTVAVGAHGRLWVAGASSPDGAPMLARVGGRASRLERAHGPVCAAVMHGDTIVMARSAVSPDVDPPTDAASADGSIVERSDAQSSPAYIDSISVA